MPLSIGQLNTAHTDQALQLLDGIYEHSPWVAEAVAEGRLTLHGAHFGVATGRLVLVPAEGDVRTP